MKIINDILDNLYCYSLDAKENLKFFKSQKSNGKQYKINTKNLFRDIVFIFIIAFIGTILITINNFSTKPLKLNSNKIKQIEIINFVQENGGKKMVIDQREGIETVILSLNDIKKVKEKNDEIDDVFLQDEIKKEERLIFVLHYKNTTDFFEINNNTLIKNKKEINISYDDINTLWYTLNYNIVDISKNEINDILNYGGKNE